MEPGCLPTRPGKHLSQTSLCEVIALVAIVLKPGKSQGPKLLQGKLGQDSRGSQEPTIPNVVPLTALLRQGKRLGCAKAQTGSRPEKPMCSSLVVTAHAKQANWTCDHLPIFMVLGSAPHTELQEGPNAWPQNSSCE